MAKVKLVTQMQQTECGLCVLLMILNYYGVNITLNDLNKKMEIGRDGMSIKSIKEIFSSYNLISRTVKIDFSNYKENKKLLPAIAMHKNGHYVVIGSINKRGAVVFDPAVGKRLLPIKELKTNYFSAVVFTVPGEKFSKIEGTKSESILLKCVQQYKKEFLKIIFISMLVYMGMFLIPLLSKQLIDSIMYKEVSLVMLQKWLLVICIAFFTYYSLNYVKSIANINVSMIIDEFLSNKVVDKLFRNNLKFFLLRPSADLQYRLALLRNIKILLNQMLVGTIIDAGSAIIIFIYVLYVQPLYSLVLIAASTIIISMNLLLRNKMVLYKNEETISDSQLQILQHDIFRSIFDIKALGLEDRKKEAWTKAFSKYLNHHRKYEILMAFYRTMLTTLNLFVPIFTIIIGGWIIFKTKYVEGIGTIVSLQAILGLFLSSILSISQLFENIYLIRSYMIRINDILEQEEEKEGEIRVDFSGNIKIENLNFSYPGSEKKILDNINLEIRAGQKIAFTGCSGSGKSTLLNVLSGLYTDYIGKITVEGIDFKSVDSKNYRQQIGVVPQTPVLFNGSLRDNLDQDECYTDEELYKVLKIVSLDKFIQNLPMKLNTIIVENGSNFSGGQKQRLAVARALLNTKHIMFLDEATSSIDSVTEAQIVKYLTEMKITQIVIAHRLSTIRDADCIYVLNDGKIVEEGTHDELLKLKGEYYKLNKIRDDEN